MVIAILSYSLSRKASQEAALVKRLRPVSSAWLIQEDKSVRIFPQNTGNIVASGFKILVRYVHNAKIEALDSGSFIEKEGGRGNFYVLLEANRVSPGAWVDPISVTAKVDGQQVQPVEIIPWCARQGAPT